MTKYSDLKVGQRIAHGMLAASLFSTLAGMHIPGTGAIYESQTLEFLRPVFIGDTLIAWFEIIAIDPEKELIEIKSWIENQDGQKVEKLFENVRKREFSEFDVTSCWTIL